MTTINQTLPGILSLNSDEKCITLERKFSPDILAFLNSVSESDIRRLMAAFQREKKSTRTSNAQEAFALLEKNPLNKIRENSTQLLREIRDND